jgi:hypothetical protein
MNRRYSKNLIYLGKCYENCYKIRQIENDLYYGHRPQCLHAYLIKNTFAKEVVSFIKSAKLVGLFPEYL